MRARSRHLLIAALVLSGATARGTDDPDTEIARRRFAAGAHLYEDGRYDEAIAEFMAARAVKSAPAFDYNIARSYDRLERFPAAVEWYQRFLAHAPEGPERTTAAERLVVLQERITAPVLTPTVERVAGHERHHRYPLALPATFAAVGIATLVTGGALYGVSAHRYDNLANEGCGSTRLCDSSVYGSTRNLERAGVGLLIAGGVLAAVDVGLWAGWVAR